MISLLKRALPFLLTLMVGLGLGSIFGFGGRSSTDTASWRKHSSKWRMRHNSDCPSRVAARSVFINFKPEPTYTDAANAKQLSGIVRLTVEFKDDGTIGDIETVDGLPYGLTEEALEAARGIQFTPATFNGAPITSRRVVEFSFAPHDSK